MQTKELIDIIPIKLIENSMMANGSGDITVGFHLVLPEIFTMSDEQAEEMEESFMAMLRMLKSGDILHKQDFFYVKPYENHKKIDNIIQRANVHSYLEQPILKHYCNLYFTFSNKFFIKKPKNISNVFPTVRVFKSVLSSLKEDRIEEIEDIVLNVQHTLNRIEGCECKRMDNHTLAAAIYDYLNQSYDRPAKADSSIEDQCVHPIGFDKKSGILQVGNKFVSVLSLIHEGPSLDSLKYPKVSPASIYNKDLKFSHTIKRKASLTYPIGIGLPVNHILNTTIQIVDNDVMQKSLETEKIALNPYAVLGHSGAKKKRSSIDAYIKNIEEKNLQSCLCHVDLIIQSDNREELKKNTGIAELHFDYMNNSKAIVENMDAESLFFLSCPGNTNWNYRQIRSITKNAVMYLHKETHYLNSDGGLLYADRFGCPVHLNFRSKKIGGANKVVFGPTRSGKSFNMNEYVNQCLFIGYHIVIIDIAHSYKKLCNLHNGIYYDSSNKDLLSFNIFLDCNKDKFGNYLYLDLSDKDDPEGHIIFVLSCIVHLLKGNKEIDQTEYQILKNSIMWFYDYVNENRLFPDFNLYYEYVLNIFHENRIYKEENYDKYFDINSFKIMMKPYYKGGSYENLLNAKNGFDIVNERLVVFEAEAIQKNTTIFPLFCLIIMNLFNKKISNLPLDIPKELLIDEALDFLKDPKMGPYVGFQYRTTAKKGGGICIAMQNVSFLESFAAEVRNSITINTSTYIILSHREHTIYYPAMKSILSFTDNDIAILDSLEQGDNWREVFIKAGSTPKAYRIGLSDVARLIYSTDPKDVQPLNELNKRLNNYGAAVLQHIENLKNKAIEEEKNLVA